MFAFETVLIIPCFVFMTDSYVYVVSIIKLDLKLKLFSCLCIPSEDDNVMINDWNVYIVQRAPELARKYTRVVCIPSPLKSK